MLKRLGVEVQVAANPSQLRGSKAIILPGVGKFDKGAKNLVEGGWKESLKEHANGNSCWILGICLGMQLLGLSSEEGEAEGLGLIDAHTVRLSHPPEGSRLKIPHMGWSQLTVKEDSELFYSSKAEQIWRFYFVHSYHVVPRDKTISVATANYSQEFTACIQNKRILGVQFHPEKSHNYGFGFFRNFISLVYEQNISARYTAAAN